MPARWNGKGSIPNTNIALLELFQDKNQYIVVGD
jgi:hypothetical protein